MIYCQALAPTKAYTPNKFLSDLENGIWSELQSGKPIDLYRRNLQRVYVAKILSLQNAAGTTSSAMYTSDLSLIDLLSVLKAHKIQLLKKITVALSKCKDQETKWHLADMLDRLKDPFQNSTLDISKKIIPAAAITNDDDNLLDKVIPFEEVMQSRQVDCWGMGN